MNKEKHDQVIVNQHTAKRLNLTIFLARGVVLSTAFLKPMKALSPDGDKNIYQTLSYRGQYYQSCKKVFANTQYSIIVCTDV